MTLRVRSRFLENGRENSQTRKARVDALENPPDDDSVVLIATPDVDIINYEVEVTFPTSSSTKRAGLVFAHNGLNSYHVVALDRNAGKIALHKVTNGSWGSALASATATINDSTAYTIKV